MGILSPALFGARRFRVAPSIGHRGHRPWAASIGKGSKRGALSLAALALTGCATTHVRYVPTPCTTPEQVQKLKDAEPEHIGFKLTGNAQEDFKLAAGNDIALRLWGEGLLGVIQGCTSNTGGSH